MTDKFIVGQRVRILYGIHNGGTGTIGTPKMFGWLKDIIAGVVRETWFYRIDVDGHGPIDHVDGMHFSYEEHRLTPIYDGNEKTTWQDCYKVTGWKPKEVVKLD